MILWVMVAVASAQAMPPGSHCPLCMQHSSRQTADTPDAPAPSELRVAVLGDSTSRTPEGAAPEFAPNGWPQRFSLADASIQSAALSGSRTADLANQWNNITNDPHVVVIMIGINDHIVYDRTQAEARADLSAVVSARVAEGRKVLMVKSLPWGDWASWEPLCQNWRDDLWSWQLTQCNGTTVVCADLDAPTADMSDPARTRLVAAYTYDGVHPGSAGSDVLADLMEPLVEALR